MGVYIRGPFSLWSFKALSPNLEVPKDPKHSRPSSTSSGKGCAGGGLGICILPLRTLTSLNFAWQDKTSGVVVSVLS